MQETLRKYSPVPVVTRQAAVDEEICGYKVPKGAYIACLLTAVHESEWANPREWKPERFLPGGEYESFNDSIRPHKVNACLKCLCAGCCCSSCNNTGGIKCLQSALWTKCLLIKMGT